ncbi:MAG: hypothetical protein ACE5G1_11810 [bacterium]
MSNHRLPNFDELEVGQLIKTKSRLLRIIEIDYRRNILYYEEVGSNKRKQGSFTKPSYLEECQGGKILAVARSTALSSLILS